MKMVDGSKPLMNFDCANALILASLQLKTFVIAEQIIFSSIHLFIFARLKMWLIVSWKRKFACYYKNKNVEKPWVDS